MPDTNTSQSRTATTLANALPALTANAEVITDYTNTPTESKAEIRASAGTANTVFILKINKPAAFQNQELSEFIKSVKHKKYAELITSIRKATTTVEKNNLKAKLPAIASGRYTGGTPSATTYISGSSTIITADYGNVPTGALNSFKAMLFSHPSVVACFVSPSGKGLKTFFRVPPIRDSAHAHKLWEQVNKECLKLIPVIKLDPSGKDVAGRCFVSSDANICINLKAQALIETIEPELQEAMMKIGINSGSISNTTLKAWSPSHEEFRLTLLTATIGTKDGPYLVRCAGTERTNAGTEKIAYLLIIDGDSRIDENGQIVSGAPNPIEVSLALGGISHIISSSHSNGATKEELDDKGIDSGGLYGADYHKYRVYIICTYTPEQLPALLEYFFNQLHKAGVMLAPVPENKTWAQAWYLPRVPDSARLELHKFIDEEGARLDVEQIHSDWLSTQPAVEEPLLVERTDSYTADCKRDPIAEFNQAITVHDVLLRNGYVLVGTRYQRPNSDSNTPGVTLCKKTKDSKDRIYSHGGDVLNDGFAHDAFDCNRLLECDGDWKKALNWNADITKHNQSLFMENKSAQETFDSFDILVGVAPKEINTNKDFPLPFRGAMTSIVSCGLASAHKPQPKLTVLSALIGMASAIEGIYHFVDGTRVNLYGLGIAETGEGKEKLRYLANEVGRKAGALLLGKPASGQGLEDALVDRQGMLVVVDEVGHMLQSMNHKQSASYLIELTEMLLKLYSASSGSYSTRVKAFSKGTQLPRVLNNPCLSFLGFTTPAALSKGVSSENIEQGFLGRFLIVDGENNVKHRRVAQEFSLDTEMIERIGFAISIHCFGYNGGLIAETPDADSKLNILINKFVEEASKAPTPESRALLKRSYEKVIRIAGVLAVWDCPNEPVVSVEHIDWSETFVRYSNQCLLEFAENNIHENQQLADAAKVLDVVKKLITEDIKISNKSHHVIRKLNSNWVAKSAVLKASKLFKVQFDMALAHLLTMESLGEGIYNNTNTNKNIGYLYLEES